MVDKPHLRLSASSPVIGYVHEIKPSGWERLVGYFSEGRFWEIAPEWRQYRTPKKKNGNG